MKLLKLLVVGLFMIISANAGMFQTVDKKEATLLQSSKNRMYCPNCGMNLVKFYKTSHAIELKDGSHRQYCSIHCLVEDMEMGTLRGKHDSIKQIKVVDIITNKFIDAKKATYVVGSKKKGTMTMTSKYAFANISDAQKFANLNGGDVLDFNGAYMRAVSDFTKDMGLVFAKRSTKIWKMGKKLYNNRCDKAKINSIDAHTMGEMKSKIVQSGACGKLKDSSLQAVMLYIWDQKLGNFEKKYGANKEIKANAEKIKKKMINAKKMSKKYKKGKKIYEQLCNKIEPNDFGSLLDLKKEIISKKQCGKISDKNLQLISLYLWDVKRFGELKNSDKIMQVPQDSKCPVCGMFVAKYPKWAGKIVTKDQSFYFDGVKDLMKFYFDPSKFGHTYTKDDYIDIKVTDYYTQKEIDGKNAWYVLHSNVFGPMGNELIPFEKEENAKIFLKEHNGKVLIKFSDIKKQQVYNLDK